MAVFNDLSSIEKPIYAWLVLLIVPPIIFSIICWRVNYTPPFDKYTTSLIYANVMSFLAFRLFACSAWEDISRIKHLKEKSTKLSIQSFDFEKGSKSVGEIFNLPEIAKYSLINGLIYVSEDEADNIQKQWLKTVYLFVFSAFIASSFGFEEVLKPLTPEKTAILTVSLTTCAFLFWWPLYQAHSRNLKHSRT
ncbi:MAG: hypothetical protein ACR65O_14225 [Methylomicrobium sp.]